MCDGCEINHNWLATEKGFEYVELKQLNSISNMQIINKPSYH